MHTSFSLLFTLCFGFICHSSVGVCLREQIIKAFVMGAANLSFALLLCCFSATATKREVGGPYQD